MRPMHPHTALSLAAMRSKSARPVTSRSHTPSGSRDSAARSATRAITTVSAALEARGEQSLGQVGREVVAVVLPLEPLAAVREWKFEPLPAKIRVVLEFVPQL